MRTRLLNALAGSIAALATLGAAAQGQPARFGFQEIMLNATFDAVPARYRNDCNRPQEVDKRFLFCNFQTDVGSVPMSVEISFRDSRVIAINAYFPREQFDAIWQALRHKFGQESVLGAAKVEWWASQQLPGQPYPDEIRLVRVPERDPRPDGKYFSVGTRYAVIEYLSAREQNEAVMRSDRDRSTIRSIADKL